MPGLLWFRGFAALNHMLGYFIASGLNILIYRQIPLLATLQHVLPYSPRPLAALPGSGFFLAYPTAFYQCVPLHCCNPSQSLNLRSVQSPPPKLHGRFLHITDMHPDPYYIVGASVSSGCHRKKPRKEKERSGYYGTPFRFVLQLANKRRVNK